jgi:hypothetical protein
MILSETITAVMKDRKKNERQTQLFVLRMRIAVKNL